MAHFGWFEYVTADLSAARAFHADVFGWSTREVQLPWGPYPVVLAGDTPIGGYSPAQGPRASWLAHLVVPDITAAVERVRAHGGAVEVRVLVFGDLGRVAVVRDPDDVAFALRQPSSPSASLPITNGHVCWAERWSADLDRTLGFYRAVAEVDEDTLELPGLGTYRLLLSDGEVRAALTTPRTGLPPDWLPYVQVASVSGTVARATARGARLAQPPMRIRDLGEVAIFIDPLGAPTGLVETPPGAGNGPHEH